MKKSLSKIKLSLNACLGKPFTFIKLFRWSSRLGYHKWLPFHHNTENDRRNSLWRKKGLLK